MPIILRTQDQAEALARTAGFSVANAEVMGAIAMAETFTLQDGKPYCNFGAIGDLHLVNATYGPSYGAWQVRSILAQSGTGSERDPLKLDDFDPTFNAKAAARVWLNQGFRAWSTYNSGAYLGYMLKAEHNPVPTLPEGSYMVTGGDTLSRIGSRLGYAWQTIAGLNHINGPKFVIYPGQVLLLPEFPYIVKSGDTLHRIASTVGKDLTWFDLWQHNLPDVPNPDRISVGQQLMVPRRVGA